MTAYNARRAGENPNGFNIKEGRQRSPLVKPTGFWGVKGFMPTKPDEWTYTWDGNFPVFTLAPGIVDDQAGTVARYTPADKKILFARGTPPADIKARLDDEILAIMRLQADVADPSGTSIPFLGEPLPYYEPVIVDGQEIGPEIEF